MPAHRPCVAFRLLLSMKIYWIAAVFICVLAIYWLLSHYSSNTDKSDRHGSLSNAYLCSRLACLTHTVTYRDTNSSQCHNHVCLMFVQKHVCLLHCQMTHSKKYNNKPHTFSESLEPLHWVYAFFQAVSFPNLLEG